MKKFIVLVFLFLLGIAAGLVISKRQPRVSAPSVTPTPTPAANLPVPIPLEQQLSYDVSRVRVSTPETVPVYSYTGSTSSQAGAQQLAALFGFSGAPTTDDSTGGPLYFFTSDGKDLVVGPFLSRVVYTSYPVQTESQLVDSDAVFQSLAKEVLLGFPLPEGASFSLFRTNYLTVDVTHIEDSTRESANAIELLYRITIGGVPVLSGYPDESYTTIRYTGNRALFYFSSVSLPPLIKTDKNTPVLSADEAAAMLLAGKGSVLSVSPTTGRGEYKDVRSYTFSRVSVETGELGLYFDPKATNLTPVYLFYGTATDASDGARLEVTVLVSASL